MIRDAWLQQPIAFARVGTSTTPLAAFQWTEPDLRPSGSGRTSIAPAPTFEVDSASGELRQCERAEFTLFRDENGIRPVCPFFELHGDWEGRKSGESTALTKAVIGSLDSLTWHIQLANHKAYCLTHAGGDRVEAEIEIRGEDHARHDLVGFSPENEDNPLVPRNPGIKMGAVQFVRPTDERPEIRLRFYAPAGHAYGPADLDQRLAERPDLLGRVASSIGEDFTDFHLPKERCILNPKAAWPRYKLLSSGELIRGLLRGTRRFSSLVALVRHFRVQRSELLRFLLGPTRDAGKLPPSTFAWRVGGGALLSSLGLIDDLGDGIVTCTLPNGRSAKARIVVCPPHFSPDRRPPVSIADNLADRMRRPDVRSSDWTNDANWNEAEAEIDDLLDRAFETSAASNLDALMDDLRSENESDAVYRDDPAPPCDPGGLLWPNLRNETVLDLPMTEQVRWRHRRNSADEFFEQLLRETPDVVDRWIRDPSDPQSLYYDRRMPALMRGSDRRPLHLTRRQLGALRRWVERLRARRQELK